MKYENNKIVYEAGDWVTITSDYIGSVTRGTAYKIGGQYYNQDCLDKQRFLYIEKDDMGSDNGICNIQYRLATQEEINKATGNEKIMVGENEVMFFPNDCPPALLVGCERVTKELFLKIGKRAGWL